MQLLRRPSEIPALAAGSVGTIGTFDGVHLGHQKIISRVVAEARLRDLPSFALTFEPTPAEYFAAGTPPARLTRFREKYEQFKALGIDWLFCPPFEQEIEHLEPEQFIQRLLIDQLRVRHLVVGDDFVFAHRRRGTVEDLVRAGAEEGFEVEQLDSIVSDGKRVSSTEIRRSLEAGELDTATRLLGRPYSMTGRVVDGQKLGKELGFPTANVNLNRRASPIAGIFAVRVAGLGDLLLDGVASLGTRPTVDGIEPLLEVHIFDFEREIYGEYIRVDFIARLRDEVRFDDLQSMTAQMHIDAAQARAILAG